MKHVKKKSLTNWFTFPHKTVPKFIKFKSSIQEVIEFILHNTSHLGALYKGIKKKHVQISPKQIQNKLQRVN